MRPYTSADTVSCGLSVCVTQQGDHVARDDAVESKNQEPELQIQRIIAADELEYVIASQSKVVYYGVSELGNVIQSLTSVILWDGQRLEIAISQSRMTLAVAVISII